MGGQKFECTKKVGKMRMKQTYHYQNMFIFEINPLDKEINLKCVFDLLKKGFALLFKGTFNINCKVTVLFKVLYQLLNASSGYEGADEIPLVLAVPLPLESYTPLALVLLYTSNFRQIQ